MEGRIFNCSLVLLLNRTTIQFLNENIEVLNCNGLDICIVVCSEAFESELKDIIDSNPWLNWKIYRAQYQFPEFSYVQAFNAVVPELEKELVCLVRPGHRINVKCFLNGVQILGRIGKSSVSLMPYNDSKVLALSEQGELPQFNGLLAKCEDFISVGGFSLEAEKCGLEFHNMKERLCMYGIRNSNVLDNTPQETNRSVKLSRGFGEILFPAKVKNDSTILNKIKLQRGLDTVRHERWLQLQSRFEEIQLMDTRCFEQEYRVIALVPMYNEKERLSGFLKNVETQCDGIILLDDGSNDGSFECAQSSKILLKAKKKREEFDDLGNRNLLLQLASLFSVEWLFFMDVDEMFDNRFDSVYDYIDRDDVDSIAFYMIHHWDGPEYYRLDMEDVNQTMSPGIYYRWRMFRNTGCLQLKYNRKLHFPTIPYINKRCYAKILVKHTGYLEKQKRMSKYHFYQKEDVGRILNYEFIKDKNVQIARVDEIQQSALQELGVS
ncbi:MAG: glycosyltransferase [Marinifilaceae bacterium]